VNQIKEPINKYLRAIVQWGAAVKEFNLVERSDPVEGDKKLLDNLQTTTLAMVSACGELMAAMEGLK